MSSISSMEQQALSQRDGKDALNGDDAATLMANDDMITVQEDRIHSDLSQSRAYAAQLEFDPYSETSSGTAHPSLHCNINQNPSNPTLDQNDDDTEELAEDASPGSQQLPQPSAKPEEQVKTKAGLNDVEDTDMLEAEQNEEPHSLTHNGEPPDAHTTDASQHVNVTIEEEMTLGDPTLRAPPLIERADSSAFSLPGLGLICQDNPQISVPHATKQELEDSTQANTRYDEFVRAGKANKGDENAEWELDSNPISSDDSSSDSSTESSDSDSDEDDEDDYSMLDPAEQAAILMREEPGEAREANGKQGPKTQNEQLEEFTKPDIVVTPKMKITELGQVEHIVYNLVIIRGKTSGEYKVLEPGSLVCLENRKVVGVVREPMGPVQGPLYSVGLPATTDITDLGVTQDTKIFYVEDHSTYVFTKPLRGVKGSDASNMHDEEVEDNELEFSDDEAEANYKRKIRQSKRKNREEDLQPSIPQSSAAPSAASFSGALDYDDEGADDFYTPLARPDDYSAMVGAQAASHQEKWRPSPSRGGRGGHPRDRGTRGRDSRYQRNDRGASQIPDSSRRGQRSQYSSQRSSRGAIEHSSPRPETQRSDALTRQSFDRNATRYSPSAQATSQQQTTGFPQPSTTSAAQAPFNLTPPVNTMQNAFGNSAFAFPQTPSASNSSEGLPNGAFINPHFFQNPQPSPQQSPANQQQAQLYMAQLMAQMYNAQNRPSG